MDSLQTVSKAIAGALASALVAYAVKHGVVLDESVAPALTVVLAGVIGFVVTYISPRNK